LAYEKSGPDDLHRGRSLISRRYKSVCQLEGSDHGGRDSAAELALAGTKDFSIVGLADFRANPPNGLELYTSKKIRQRICAKAASVGV
jgi:hypothetical protein